MMKEELCGKVVEVRRKNDRIMTMVLVFEEEVMRVISAYGAQCRWEEQIAKISIL